MALIDKLRQQTYEETMELLDKYGKAAIIRPTGFGKTGILAKCIADFKHVLYLYPADVIKDTVLNFWYNGNPNEETGIENTTFMTYAKLARLSEDDMKNHTDIDLIIADECHRLGGAKTKTAMAMLLENLPDAKLLGATATPDRMDLVDEISDFFDNHVTSKYTLHDAFQDKILHRPYYVFCSYGKSDLSEAESCARLEIDKMDNIADRENAKKLLRSRLIEISSIHNMENVIKNTCDKYAPDTNYMKFIVFFASFAHMHEKEFDVKDWFEKAYPSHNIDILKISSETKEFTENVKELDSQTYQDKTIDLIFCCDMLNMGYHVDDMTGIVMYRGTESGIIFAQQLGRTLSSGSKFAGIVFDVVDNIHREAMYDVLGQTSKSTLRRKMRYEELMRRMTIAATTDPSKALTKQESVEFQELNRAFNQTNWWHRANELEPEDLIATDYEATYRELIAKTVAEPISMRARQAWRLWVEKGGDESVLTWSAILGQNVQNGQVPLAPFCKLKSVTVGYVLNVMGIDNDMDTLSA